MELTEEEKNKVLLEVAKMVASRIDLKGIKREVARLIYKDIITQLDFNYLAQQTIKFYKHSTKIKLSHQADRSLYELFCDISKRVTKLEITRIRE